MNKDTTSGSGSISTTLFIVFVVLKLAGVIDWSWWWVTSPIWIWFALVFVIIFVAFILKLFL